MIRGPRFSVPNRQRRQAPSHPAAPKPKEEEPARWTCAICRFRVSRPGRFRLAEAGRACEKPKAVRPSEEGP